MKASEIRNSYLKFFKEKEHNIIPPAPIIPTDDPTTLFTNSGMQQLVPYLKGEDHPMGKRLTDSQPCFRAEDIEEVGDNRHTTMFEMLGNWSLGDYFKKEQLSWFWEFLTKNLSLNPQRLYITLFEGDSVVPKDKTSHQIWLDLGVSDSKIFFYPASKNWWSRSGEPSNMPEGEIGGPTSEVFYEFDTVDHDPAFGKECHPNCDCGKYIEIGNSVFMEYEMTKNGLQKLPHQNVDFGGGLERLTTAVQNTPDVFETDMFKPIISAIEQASGKKYASNQSAMRIIADHLRGATFMGAQGILPSNKLQGYFMRRLLRRAAVQARSLGTTAKEIFLQVTSIILMEYTSAGFISSDKEENLKSVISDELDKFNKALIRGEKEIKKTKEEIDEKFAFDLYQSLGFPFEITQELLKKKGITLDKAKFNNLLEEHKEKSRTASSGMFKGGLADKSAEVTKLHTATHLLHQALRKVLGEEVTQQGSNITAKRLRFDYSYPSKPSTKELTEIENLINEKIKEDLPVHKQIQSKNDALESGALAFFQEKYSDKVSVYTIGKDKEKDWFSKELCGGPHVNSTGDIGGVTIKKEENLGAGKRRIYAVLS